MARSVRISEAALTMFFSDAATCQATGFSCEHASLLRAPIMHQGPWF